MEEGHLFLNFSDGSGGFYEIYLEILDYCVVGYKFTCGGESSWWFVGVEWD